MNEPIHDVIGEVYMKKGLFKKDTYRLIFLEQSVLFIHVTKAMIKEEQKAFNEELKGMKFKERIGALIHAKERIYEEYKLKEKDALLAQGDASFELAYNDVKKVKRNINFMDDDGVDEPPIVTIKTHDQKLKLTFSSNQSSSKTYKLLKKLSK